MKKISLSIVILIGMIIIPLQAQEAKTPVPEVTKYSPDIGGKGTYIKFEGKNFAEDITVLIGKNKAAQKRYFNSGKMYILTPEGPIGKVDITLKNKNGQPLIIKEGFEYIPDLTIKVTSPEKVKPDAIVPAVKDVLLSGTVSGGKPPYTLELTYYGKNKKKTQKKLTVTNNKWAEKIKFEKGMHYTVLTLQDSLKNLTWINFYLLMDYSQEKKRQLSFQRIKRKKNQVPEHNKTIFRQGHNLYLEGKYAEALTQFQKNIKTHPKAHNIDYNYGWALMCYAKLNKYDQTIDYYAIMRKRFPGDYKTDGLTRNWEENLFAIREMMKKHTDPKAKECLAKLQEIDKKHGLSPDDFSQGNDPTGKYHNNKRFKAGLALMGMGNYEKALSYFQQNIKETPKANDIDCEYANGLHCLIALKKYDEAFKYYKVMREKYSGTITRDGWTRNWEYKMKFVKKTLANDNDPKAKLVLIEIKALDEKK